MSHESGALSFKDLSSLFQTLPELKTNIEDGISSGEVSSVNVSELPLSFELTSSEADTPVNQEVATPHRAPKTPK